MNIYWFGHSCFLIKTKLGKRILMDPFDIDIGYTPYKNDVDIVTISHMHFDHNCTNYINKEAKIFKDLVNYENDYCKITSFHSFHDNCMGLKRDKNFIFKIICDGISLCHLGDLGHTLSHRVLSKIGYVDVLFIPVGEQITLPIEEVIKVIDDINPRVVIPMHYKTEKINLHLNSLDGFLMKIRGFKLKRSSVFSLYSHNLPSEKEVHILDISHSDLI
ncbi:MBL fold metallo-hydrolase [Clostridium sp.]|uniref:MBL fold metallo-hydrolase n=1 Tax=Clostridium sp. TaxID=1506 RepID=UPI002626DD3F|nr:MBL fold metallo-hydrolase [Clostridium sp.]